MQATRCRGFTLIELMIVVVIIAILASIAIPSYRNHICKVERNQAKADLQAFAQAMERYYTTNNFSYVNAFGVVPSTGADAVFANRWSPSDGAAAKKRFDLAPIASATNKSTYELIATRLTISDCADGSFKITSAGVKTRDKDLDGTYDIAGWDD